MNKRKLLPLLVLLIPAIIGTQLFNNGSSHVEVIDTAKELEIDNGKLENANNQLKKANSSLKKQVNSLNKEVSSLQKINNSLSKNVIGAKKNKGNEKNVTTSVSSGEKFNFKPIDLPDSEDN